MIPPKLVFPCLQTGMRMRGPLAGEAHESIDATHPTFLAKVLDIYSWDPDRIVSLRTCFDMDNYLPVCSHCKYRQPCSEALALLHGAVSYLLHCPYNLGGRCIADSGPRGSFLQPERSSRLPQISTAVVLLGRRGLEDLGFCAEYIYVSQG